MFFQLFAVIVIDALILCVTLRLLAKHEADYSFPKCAMVVSPIVVAPLILAAVLAPHLPPVLVLVAVPLLLIPFAIYMVSKYCWLSWPKAIPVVVVLCVGHTLLSLGIAAARRELHKSVRPVERKQPAKSSREARAREVEAQSDRAAKPPDRPPSPRRTPSARDRLLAEAGARMAGRLSAGDQLGALAKAAGGAGNIVMDSASFRCASSRSDWDATLTLAVRVPKAGEQTVQGLLDQLKDDPAFRAPWRVAVTSFAADTSPGASREARTAVIECALRAPRSLPAGGAGTCSDDDVRFVKESVLAPTHGNYLLPATEEVKKAAAAVSLAVESVKEMGIFPSPGGKGAPAMESYAVRVSGAWTLADAARLVGTIEENLLLQVQAMDVRQQQGTRGMAVTVDVAWPVWREPARAEAVLLP